MPVKDPDIQPYLNLDTPHTQHTQITLLSRIRDWIRFALSEFRKANLHYGHGTDNALDEAVYLILHTLNLPLDIPNHLYDSVLTLEERQSLQDIIQKRIETRKPCAYLTHESFFMDLCFYVDERVLIPRSPIAELIQKHFSPWLPPDIDCPFILDLCTGSGCMAIACAYAFPEAKITASDISLEALEVAKINREKHHLTSQEINFIQSNLFEHLSDQKFDIIISNPPYVDKEDMETLPKEYLYEPKLALSGGIDGLDIIRKILSDAKNYLSDTGILIVETGNSAEALIKAYPHVNFTWLEFEHGDSEVFLLTKDQLP